MVHTRTLLYLLSLTIGITCVLTSHADGQTQVYPSSSETYHTLSHQDTLIQEMVEFLQPDYKPTKAQRRRIEGRIRSFPHKIVRRDTISHFLNTAYAIAYYEFVKHDYVKGMAWCKEFQESSMTPGLFSNFFNYSSIGLNASSALTEKGKIKVKKDKNSWWTPISFGFFDSIKWDPKRSYVDFLDSFIDDVPVDLATPTYRKLLTAYHDGGGRLDLLNGVTQKGFVQRCKDVGREDVLKIVYELWNVTPEDFTPNQINGYLEYRIPVVKVDSAAVAKTYDDLLLFDVDVCKHRIDSLISIGAEVDLTPRIMRLALLCFNQYRFQDLVTAGELYQDKVAKHNLATFHDFWALALSNLGRYEEALRHYDVAIANATDPRNLSTMRMNKACTLGEVRRDREAVEIFMEEHDRQITPFEKFVWHDNLGYIYSFTDPVTALYHYTQAEKFLDSGTLYADRKIRHFCRKARVLNHNKFLQRTAIDKAIEYAGDFFTPLVPAGMAYAEKTAFAIGAFNYEEAEQLLEKVFKCYAVLEPSDLRMLYACRLQAEMLARLGRSDEAAGILLRQLETVERTYGKRHEEYLLTLCSLLSSKEVLSVADIDAESLYHELQALKKEGIKDNLGFELMKAEATYQESTGDWMEALMTLGATSIYPLNPMQRLETLKSLEAIMRRYLAPKEYDRVLTSYLPQLKQTLTEGLLTLSSGEGKAIHQPLSLFIDGAMGKGAYGAALELALFRKGLLYTKRRVFEQQMGHRRAVRKVYQELQNARAELNNAVAYNDSTHIPGLTVKISRLEREMGQHLANDRKLYMNLDRTLQQVTGQLQPNDLAAEFIRFTAGDDVVYGVFLIDATGLKKFIPIGTEEEISSHPEIAWSWLEAYRDALDTIYFSPDGVLNRISIEYYIPEANSYASHPSPAIHRVFHISEIEKRTSGLGEQVVLIGVSDHNSPISAGAAVNRGNWTDLQGVEDELEMVAQNLNPDRLTLLLNDTATEPNIVATLKKGVSTLHISTHGFYRSNQALSDAALNAADDDYHIARRFLSGGRTEVSGLVLREGNISWKSPYILDEHDDLLTAEEIELMHFPRLQLTVLSACDTGLGDVDSEGVWGLQRAFRMAGTKSLICTLNKVDDYWTARFMGEFYRHAARGATIYDAFHTAHRWLRRELPDNPEVWQAFILIE